MNAFFARDLLMFKLSKWKCKLFTLKPISKCLEEQKQSEKEMGNLFQFDLNFAQKKTKQNHWENTQKHYDMHRCCQWAWLMRSRMKTNTAPMHTPVVHGFSWCCVSSVICVSSFFIAFLRFSHSSVWNEIFLLNTCFWYSQRDLSSIVQILQTVSKLWLQIS